MEVFIYFVSLRLVRPNALRRLFRKFQWPFVEWSTTIALDRPIRDDNDLFDLKSRAVGVIQDRLPHRVIMSQVTILSMSLLDSYHEKSYDPWRMAKERAEEDAKRGHAKWWRETK